MIQQLFRQAEGWFPKSYVKIDSSALPSTVTPTPIALNSASEEQKSENTVEQTAVKRKEEARHGSGEWFIVSFCFLND